MNRLIRLAYGPFALGTLPMSAAEEVGPRVIRELLADFIAPENMPKGDRPVGPLLLAPGGGRSRRMPDKPGAPGAAAPAAPEAKPKKVYKAGWAKPAKKKVGPPKPGWSKPGGSKPSGSKPVGRPGAKGPPRRK